MDAIIHLRDWQRVLNLGLQRQETFIRQTVTHGVTLADTPLTGRFSRMKAALLPLWNELVHLYSSITVFFDDLPTEHLRADKSHSFFRRFMARLFDHGDAAQQPQRCAEPRDPGRPAGRGRRGIQFQGPAGLHEKRRVRRKEPC